MIPFLVQPSTLSNYLLPEARKKYCAEAVHWERDRLIFIDELGFNRDLHRNRGRSKRGTLATFETVNSSGPKINVCTAVSPKQGLVLYTPLFTTWNGLEFKNFLLTLCKSPICQHQSMIFVMDNVKFHGTEVAVDVLRGQRIQHEIKWLPTYSPHLNPIEYVFHVWKTQIKHIDQLHTDKTLLQQIDEARVVITDTLVDRCLDHVFQYYSHCMQGLPLEEFVPLGKRSQRKRLEEEAKQREQKEQEEEEKNE